MGRIPEIALVLVIALFAMAGVSYGLDIDKLSADDIAGVKNLLVKLGPVIKERQKEATLATLSMEDLYNPLSDGEKKFLRSFLELDPKEVGVKIPYRGIATGKEELVKITGQVIKVPPKERAKFPKDTRELPPVFIPPDVFKKYTSMMGAMERDIGRRLYIESGYRSSAYQLYLFIFYLSNHDHSIRETARWVALPGFSEHGSPAHQAVDFINADGVNGEDNTSEFDSLQEYAWLAANAGRYGFTLSYPDTVNNNITYEPWHWRSDRKFHETVLEAIRGLKHAFFPR
ncbi:MAG: D-alanyl-D-alanine carboxypeptidase family protein [Candidatus Omnitrophica bacterium]|nr:D-alanyl-D-alanine carboxypeptidase family protein [Candidatus Omnitrophota bacterium]